MQAMQAMAEAKWQEQAQTRDRTYTLSLANARRNAQELAQKLAGEKEACDLATQDAESHKAENEEKAIANKSSFSNGRL